MKIRNINTSGRMKKYLDDKFQVTIGNTVNCVTELKVWSLESSDYEKVFSQLPRLTIINLVPLDCYLEV